LARQSELEQQIQSEDRMGSDGCSGTVFKLGACHGEETAIGELGGQVCSSWICALSAVTAIIPIADIADALGITEAALAAGSKALDAIAPGLSDAITTGLSGVQDLIGSLTSKVSQLTTKVSDDETIATQTAASASNTMNWVRLAQQLKEEEISSALEGLDQTAHGAERLAGRGFTGEDVIQTLNGTPYVQEDGAVAYVSSTADKYNVIIIGDNGVVSAMKDWPLKSVNGIARNHGWQGWGS
jgi:hypothetical protein